MVSRRRFFAELTHSLLAGMERTADAFGAAAVDDGAKCDLQSWLRPPGALQEERFLQACTRCTDCIEACPHQVIRRLGPEFGARGGTPAVIPDESPCYMCKEMPCVKACAPQALRLDDITRARMGLALIAEDNCYLAQGQPCDYCYTRCPLKGRAIAWNSRGMPEVEPTACTGCGICAYLCPASVIRIMPEKTVSAFGNDTDLC